MVTCSSPRRHVTSVKRSLEPLLSRSPRLVRRSPTSALSLPPEDPSLCCRHIVFSSIHCKTTPVPWHMWRARNFLHRAALTWRHLLANLCTCSHHKSYRDISNVISCVVPLRRSSAWLSAFPLLLPNCWLSSHCPPLVHSSTPAALRSTLCPVAARSPTS